MNYVILAGKRGSCRHSSSSFSENLLAVETSHRQMLKVLAFCDRKMAFKTSSIKIKMRTFLSEEVRTMKLFGASIF